MLVFISPAKSLDFESNNQIGAFESPFFLEEAEKVNRKVRALSRKKLRELQSISPALAELNHTRNQSWEIDKHKQGKQAVLAFTGDVYQGLEASQWSVEDMDFANHKLRILSGLYGILKPSDVILPYRLEMGTSLPVGRRKNLYHFWGDKVSKYFKEELAAELPIINLASNEYFRAVETAQVKNPVIDIVFKDFNKGDYKIISFLAKKARGMMANYIVKNRLSQPEELKKFNISGYYFDDKASTNCKYVFLKD